MNSGVFSNLQTVFCSLFGSNSILVAFVAAGAVLVFFVILALNEGNSMMTWALKILIGVAGLVSATSLVSSLFGAQNLCTGSGSILGWATPAPDVVIAASETATRLLMLV